MARLLTWIDGVGMSALSVVEGANVRNSGANTASDGSEQGFSSIGDVWTFELGLTIARGMTARRTRGVLDAMLGGVNAIRFTIFDPDVMTPAEAGLQVASHLEWYNLGGQPWSNAQPWSNGQGWASSYPVVKVGASAAVNTSIVTLQDEFWGHALGIGDRFGFFPSHFGMYQVTQVIYPGIYRVKHLLRKAVTYSADPGEVDYATLFPVIALKPVNNSSALAPKRGATFAENTNVRLVEVIDSYVRSDFAD